MTSASRETLVPSHGRPANPLRAAVIVAVVGVAVATSSHAQTVRSDLYATDGDVSAIATSANTIYIAGSFSRVGPPTGSCAPLDATTAKATAFPAVVGRVLAAVADGSGGWFIAVFISQVTGVPRNGLAHLASDYSLTSWDPGIVTGTVRTLARSGTTLVIGGDFTSVGGQSRANLAAIDVGSASVLPWNPGTAGPLDGGAVYALQMNGGTVIAGGAFTTAGGQSRGRLAAIDLATGTATAWNPGADSTVWSLLVNGGTVYAGGDFSQIGGAARNRLAALDATTGIATA